jgi:uncharacterized membrane protein HdeD (DUF308 family)
MHSGSLWALGLVEGIAALLFGIAAVFWPGETIVTLVYLFAAFILVSGIVNLVGGIFLVGMGGSVWIMKVLLAVLEIGVGVYLMRHPHVTFTALILLIGFILIIRGIFEIVAAFIDDLGGGARVMLAIAGGLAILVGIYMLFQPVSGGVAFVWALGLYALIAGPVMIADSLREHRRLSHPAHK